MNVLLEYSNTVCTRHCSLSADSASVWEKLSQFSAVQCSARALHMIQTLYCYVFFLSAFSIGNSVRVALSHNKCAGMPLNKVLRSRKESEREQASLVHRWEQVLASI